MAIIGTHMLLYSSDAERLRAVLRDAFGFESVDAGQGWLIFAMPTAEVGIHPAGSPGGVAGTHQLSFMCDDIRATIAELRAKGIEVEGEPTNQGFGIVTMLKLPGGVNVMLYEPRHPTAIARS